MKLTILRNKFENRITLDFEKTQEGALKMQNRFLKELSKTYLKRNVIVLFVNSPQDKDFREEQSSILISHDHDYLTHTADYFIRKYYGSYKDLTLVLNTFKSYESAFKYCIDLKEGF
jgi:hypothetical protein